MNTIRNFVYKHKIPCAIFLLLVSSFSIYYFAFADEDLYENQIEATITQIDILDGTEPFDTDDLAGNDSSNNNKIIRNFDDIQYTVSYNLRYKSNSTLSEEEKNLGITRNIEINVLIPSNISVNVALDPNGYESAKSQLYTIEGDKQYNNYVFKREAIPLSVTNTIDIYFLNIIAKNGEIIEPIIRIKETTDTDVPVIEESGIKASAVTVSAQEKYGIKLYEGTTKKDDVTTFPIGILVYLPYDESKGIKGIEIPDKINFDLTMTASSNGSHIIEENSNPFISDYDSSRYTISDMAEPYLDDNNKVINGSAGIGSITLNENNVSTFPIEISNLVFHNGTTKINESDGISYLSSKMFVVKTQRTIEEDVTYTVAAPNNTIQVVDNYELFAGSYLSKIDFINKSNIEGSSDGPTFNASGESIYNYNEDFYIQDTITYTNGDILKKGFTNYIKVDNEAIQIGDISNESNDYYVQVIPQDGDSVDNYDFSVQYGVGEWNASNFEIKSDAPSYCPSNINSLTKEQLMNYYGGPCIQANNNIKWYNTIFELNEENQQNINKIIIVKFNMNSEYKPGVKTIIRLHAKVVNDISNVGKTYQIVSRGEAIWEKGNNSYTYYLSETPKISVSNQSQDITYNKTIYNNGQLQTINEPADKYGNTLLVSPFKASINSVTLYDVYGSIRSNIYSGLNDPMEIVINPVIYKSDSNATMQSANIAVYIPSNIELQLQKGDRNYSSTSQVSIDGISYTIYNYSYTEDDIKYENESPAGTIPNLIIHAIVKIDTQDSTPANIKAIISGTLKVNDNSITTFTDVTPIDKRTESIDITLRNTKGINSIGRTDSLYIDKNGSYVYNMRSTNITGESATLELLNILPFSGDSVGEGSEFSGKLLVSIESQLPSGYSAYYTNDNSKTILSNELSTSSSVKWELWNNYSVPISATAIKIVSNSQIPTNSYFAGENGINLRITTKDNNDTDNYSNNFYMIYKNAELCVDMDILQGICNRKEVGIDSYSSNISYVSVYNRTISGMVFEDSNYNGLSSDNEKRLSDVVVELYSLNKSEYDPKKPVESISAEDKLVDEGVTNTNGTYSFKGLKSGNYYVKYIFDCNKYTVTEKNKTDPTVEGDTSLKDSDADMVTIEENENSNNKNKCYAISNIIKLDNSNVNVKNIDLGLRVRQEFDVKVKKYITNVVVTSNKGTQTYKYNNEQKVKIDIKNLKNTSFRVTYGIEIENSKYFPGTIGNIVESIPENMTFNSNLSENEGWYESNGNLYYTKLNKTLIMPGEKYHLTIVLDLVTNSGGEYINLVVANNLKMMPVVTNFLEIPVEDDFEEIPVQEESENREKEE